MSTRELTQRLQALAADHPGLHPYTLALLWQQQSGQQLSGRQVQQLLLHAATRLPSAKKRTELG
jgi:hypothetical protein